MKLCVIYACDGGDTCVFRNLRRFYSNLGFRVLFSKKIVSNCSLLVIMRGNDVWFADDFDFNTPVHVYNYTGLNQSRLIDVLDKKNINYLYFSITDKIREQDNVCAVHALIVKLPVYPELWAKKIKKRQFKFVHVGANKIKFEKNKSYVNLDFEMFIRIHPVKLWGNGWGDSEKHISVYNLHKIYGVSEFGLGLMYSFQNQLGTFSSRYFQAPLNGCYLFTEGKDYLAEIPGLIYCDYKNTIDSNICNDVQSAALLQQKAISYWTKETRKTEEAVAAELSRLLLKDYYSLKVYFKYAFFVFKWNCLTISRKIRDIKDNWCVIYKYYAH
jgi:hypothetical protein